VDPIPIQTGEPKIGFDGKPVRAITSPGQTQVSWRFQGSPLKQLLVHSERRKPDIDAIQNSQSSERTRDARLWPFATNSTRWTGFISHRLSGYCGSGLTIRIIFGDAPTCEVRPLFRAPGCWNDAGRACVVAGKSPGADRSRTQDGVISAYRAHVRLAPSACDCCAAIDERQTPQQVGA
jgi:hypothetical protein